MQKDMLSSHEISKIVSRNGLFLEQVPFEKKTDDIVKKALMQNGNAFKFLTRSQKNNREFALIAIDNNAIPDNKFPPPIRSDYELMTRSVEVNGNNLFYIRHDFKQDIDISIAAVLSAPEAIKYVSPKIVDKVMLTIHRKRQKYY